MLFESLHGRGTADVGGGELIPQSGGGHAKGPIPKGLESRAGNWQLVLVRGPEGPQGGVGVEEVREVTGAQSVKGLVCE